MPLELTELRDLRTFTRDWANDIIQRDAPVARNDTSGGYNLAIADGSVRGAIAFGVYDQIRDRYIFIMRAEKRDAGGSIVIDQNVSARDMLCLNTSVGWFRAMNGVQLPSSIGGKLKAGQPNLETGEQKFYAFSSGNRHFEIDPLTGNAGATNIWPLILNDFITSGPTTGNAGYYTASNSGANVWQMCVFEGMTDTTGYDEIIRGGNSHPKGLGLVLCEACNFVGGANLNKRWGWIDLDKNEIVGFLPLPTRSETDSVQTFGEATIDGRVFNWHRLQFIADEGSTFAQPKGELHVTSDSYAPSNPLEVENVVIDIPSGGTFSTTAQRNYVTVYDFNPFNSQTGVVRIHNRRTFLGIIDNPQEPIFPGGPSMSGNDDILNNRCVSLVYHPPTRTYTSVVGRPFGHPNDSEDAPVLTYSRIARWRRAVVTDRLGQPTVTSVATENRSVQVRVLAFTDLAARAVGVGIDFTLHRLSTRAEAFDGTALGSGDIVVAAAEIDNDGFWELRSGNDVDNAGTLLVEGVDYSTPVFATGTISPIGSWPTDTIYVRYRHRNVKLTPAHGTLLTSGGFTDTNGQTFASVRYGANVEGELDGIVATSV